MTYEEFESAVKATAVVIGHDNSFSTRWTTGGERGRDCYGNDYGSFEAEKEPRFDELDIVLEAVAPSVTLLQYRAIEREVVHRGFYTRDDYYGVHENYGLKKVFLRELHAWLSEKALLAPPTADGGEG